MPNLPHGLSKYTNEACRCDICKRSARHYLRDKREFNYSQRVKVNGVWVSHHPDCRHGTNTAYKNYGCRCDQCKGSMDWSNSGKK